MTEIVQATGRQRKFQRPAFVSMAEHVEIADFLAIESQLLDDRRYYDWVQVVTDDFEYQVPTPCTPDTPYKPHYDVRTLLIDESRWSLSTQWFRRFDEDIFEMSWGENPPVRFRHLVTNMRAVKGEQDDTYKVMSNVALIGTRQSDLPKYLTGERTDTIIRVDGELLLQRRWVVLDQSLIDFPQLRIML